MIRSRTHTTDPQGLRVRRLPGRGRPRRRGHHLGNFERAFATATASTHDGRPGRLADRDRTRLITEHYGAQPLHVERFRRRSRRASSTPTPRPGSTSGARSGARRPRPRADRPALRRRPDRAPDRRAVRAEDEHCRGRAAPRPADAARALESRTSRAAGAEPAAEDSRVTSPALTSRRHRRGAALAAAVVGALARCCRSSRLSPSRRRTAATSRRPSAGPRSPSPGWRSSPSSLASRAGDASTRSGSSPPPRSASSPSSRRSGRARPAPPSTKGQRAVVYATAVAGALLCSAGATSSCGSSGSSPGRRRSASTRSRPGSIADHFGAFNADADYRLFVPIGYWNALGIFAGDRRAARVRGGGRRDEHRPAGPPAVALVVLLPTLYYTYSRGSWVGALRRSLRRARLQPPASQLFVALFVFLPLPALAVWLASRPAALHRRALVDAPPRTRGTGSRSSSPSRLGAGARRGRLRRAGPTGQGRPRVCGSRRRSSWRSSPWRRSSACSPSTARRRRSRTAPTTRSPARRPAART